MVFDSFLAYIFFPIYLVTYATIFLLVRKILLKRGFNVMCMFILTYSLFYLIVPFFQTYFPNSRNYDSEFTLLLNNLSDEKIFVNFLIAVLFLCLILFSYSTTIKNNLKRGKSTVDISERINYDAPYVRKVSIVADILLFISVISILLLIIETGSVSNYLSLGVLTRGLDKDTSSYIRSSYLQLVTSSVLVLATPYIYLFLYRLRNKKITFIKFLISIFFSVLYLLHEQGRAPLIIFFLPFLMVSKKIKKRNIFGLLILTIIVVMSLEHIDSLFKYLAYGYFPINEDTTSYISTFLGEFSYPFTNFALKEELVQFVGFRFGLDYLIWPFTIIPNVFLKIVGLNKENIVSVLFLNTDAYGEILNLQPNGGIPVDFLTLNFYQLGYFSLFILCIIVGYLLRYFDRIFRYFQGNLPITILLYRLSFSMINILNNNDPSAIIRNRLDVVIIVIIIIYIYKQDKKFNTRIG